MGKNNRARRAAKAQARSRVPHHGSTRDDTRHTTSHSGPDGDQRSPADRAVLLFDLAAGARLAGQHQRVEDAEFALCRLPAEVIQTTADSLLTRSVDTAWSGGWQPSELLRHARRKVSASAASLAAVAVAADHAARLPDSLDPRWTQQLAGLDLPSPGEHWIERWSQASGLGIFGAVDTIVELLSWLRWLPVIETLIPPPGAQASRSTNHQRPPSGGPVGRGSDADRTMLDKIRALLAKAESTTFEAEAEAFTAKAQELMTRHAIDAALVSGQRTAADEPIAIRIAIDDPYVDAKSMLLHVVASAGRCQAVFFSDLAASSVVGFATDVDGVELLYTSLLVQAQTALGAAAATQAAGSRQRSRAFRSSFLLAFASRIGERLAAVNAAVVADVAATTGEAFLPVLASRELAVRESVEQRYGSLRSKRLRGGFDPVGWSSGRDAADQAQLVTGALPGS